MRPRRTEAKKVHATGVWKGSFIVLHSKEYDHPDRFAGAFAAAGRSGKTWRHSGTNRNMRAITTANHLELKGVFGQPS